MTDIRCESDVYSRTTCGIRRLSPCPESSHLLVDEGNRRSSASLRARTVLRQARWRGVAKNIDEALEDVVPSRTTSEMAIRSGKTRIRKELILFFDQNSQGSPYKVEEVLFEDICSDGDPGSPDLRGDTGDSFCRTGGASSLTHSNRMVKELNGY